MPRSGHVPRHMEDCAWASEVEGVPHDSGPGLTGKPGRWEDLSVPSWGPARTWGRGLGAWKEGRQGLGDVIGKPEASGYRINQAQVWVGR